MARRKAVRVPRGVRVDGRSVGGQFTSPEGLRALLLRTDDVGRELIANLAAREGLRAEAEYKRARRRFDDDPKKYARAAAEAERELFLWEEVLSTAADLAALADEQGRPVPSLPDIADDEAPALATEIREAVTPPSEPMAVEWEIGVEYHASKGRSSDFDISIRLRRGDGLPMDIHEARHALFQLRTTIADTGIATVPAGYIMRGINWRRANDATWRRGGTERDFEAFSDPLAAIVDDPANWSLRMGAVDSRDDGGPGDW